MGYAPFDTTLAMRLISAEQELWAQMSDEHRAAVRALVDALMQTAIARNELPFMPLALFQLLASVAAVFLAEGDEINEVDVWRCRPWRTH